MRRSLRSSRSVRVVLWLCLALLMPACQRTPNAPPFVVRPGWPAPEVETGQVAGVAVDADGNVWVFRRGAHDWSGGAPPTAPIGEVAVLQFDAESGQLLQSWGAGRFLIPHGLAIDAAGNIWLTDVGLHQVFKYTPSGELLLSVGEARVAGDDAQHFNMPTDVAVAADGTFFVADGYGNSRIVKFAADGRFLLAWGEAGDAAGEFNVPHSITLGPDDLLYVADRGNARVQVFTQDGRFVRELADRRAIGRPWAVRFGPDGALFVVDGGDQQRWLPDRARFLRLDDTGRVTARVGRYGDAPGEFVWPHAIAIDDNQRIYIGEVATGRRVQRFDPACDDRLTICRDAE